MTPGRLLMDTSLLAAVTTAGDGQSDDFRAGIAVFGEGGSKHLTPLTGSTDNVAKLEVNPTLNTWGLRDKRPIAQ